LQAEAPSKVVAEYLPVCPAAEKEIVKKIVKRAEFSTYFEDNPPREHNIKLAAAQFDGLTVESGAEVSFNKIVGQRVQNRGYREAKIIIDGEYTEGIGGGVCQVSTTVFNAAVRAGLHITGSSNHSLYSSYVPMGHDAMVTAAVDLRFVNNTGAPVYFETAAADNRLTVTVYGRDKGSGVHYRLSAVTSKEYPPAEIMDKDFPVGDDTVKDFILHPENYEKIITRRGEPGYAVTTYIETYKGERLLSKRFLRRSVYRARPTKYKITPVCVCGAGKAPFPPQHGA
jgi:vancomycin resistance protein YoaR